MKQISFTKEYKLEKKEWFQLFGEEATKWFRKNCYWIPYKFSREKIDRAFHLCQKENDRNFSHFMNHLHN